MPKIKQRITPEQKALLLESVRVYVQAVFSAIIEAPGRAIPCHAVARLELLKFAYQNTGIEMPKLHQCVNTTSTSKACFCDVFFECDLPKNLPHPLEELFCIDQELLEFYGETLPDVQSDEVRTTVDEILLPFSMLFARYTKLKPFLTSPYTVSDLSDSSAVRIVFRSRKCRLTDPSDWANRLGQQLTAAISAIPEERTKRKRESTEPKEKCILEIHLEATEPQDRMRAHKPLSANIKVNNSTLRPFTQAKRTNNQLLLSLLLDSVNEESEVIEGTQIPLEKFEEAFSQKKTCSQETANTCKTDSVKRAIRRFNRDLRDSSGVNRSELLVWHKPSDCYMVTWKIRFDESEITKKASGKFNPNEVDSRSRVF